ncbi:tetratricopeptide repeat protein [Janthinobacterium fluminis]|uniref:Tetratricopeptide repeat protein n=1 Tax=Janthinobacterium fluminis TaxID=2987524 RepID=A0ABT5K2R8_9BURK|nr:tetratricopeptide repeat protein [Janthinobacterium fluminis]MDC8759279.1 tetratricopeptide repeat protein [Janthinobacterium fluminis]
MKHWAILTLLCALLGACATTPPAPPPPAELFADALFAPPSEAVDADAIFAVSEPMRLYLRTEIASQLRHKPPRRALFDALYSKGQLKLEYDAAATRNASQTFAARAGNCLSLVIMTAAMAKEMGLSVQYQSVLAEESWSRSGDLYFVSGHVNLVLGKKRTDALIGYDSSTDMTIDFQPPEQTSGDRTAQISEATVVAMYMNNRAAEALAQDRLDDAYWWASAAIRAQPGFTASYNTLGVTLRRHGNLEPARRNFALALEQAPADTRVMDNLAQTLTLLGRDAEAATLRHRLAQLLPHPPFDYFNRGLAAMRHGDFQQAAALFSKELERDPYYHEFHFWLAQAYLRLGDTARAERQLGLALDESTSSRDRQLYAAKLDRLKSLAPR